uniref:Uncharacterized protein n=1 Tax=Ditylenchus dipsaci TaxID=166011 RepID=A0A915EPD3_9BILA
MERKKQGQIKKMVAVAEKSTTLQKHKWLNVNINDAGDYQPNDLNLPAMLWARPEGAKGYINDSPITEVGATSCQILGRGLRKSPVWPLQRIYCSPALRSVQSAVEIAKGIHKPVEICVEPALYDFLGWYKTMPSLLSIIDLQRFQLSVNPEYDPSKSVKELRSLVGKETVDGFYARVSKTVESIVKRESDLSHFCIVSHAPVLDAAIKFLKGSPSSTVNEVDFLHMGTYYPYVSTVTFANNKDEWSYVHDPFPPFCYLGTTNRVNAKFVERTTVKEAVAGKERQR